jgi:DtxR family Mn-dependent transcriptional regulator
VLQRFFQDVLGVSGPQADEAACRMEHEMPAEVMGRLLRFLEFAEACPRRAAGWIDGFRFYCKHGALRPECEECIAARE